MKIAMVAAGFDAHELDELRKAMATFRARGTIGALEQRMVGRMVARGYDRDFAERCFNQIKGFGEYGFPESHAAAFAAALPDSQPLGLYAPAPIVRDALRPPSGAGRGMAGRGPRPSRDHPACPRKTRETQKAAPGWGTACRSSAPQEAARRERSYLILPSLYSTCFRTTGSYFVTVIFSVIVRAFFLVT
jgi:hypothetical protein